MGVDLQNLAGGRGLGSALPADVLPHCRATLDIAGVRGVMGYAIDEDAARCCERYGFVPSPLGEQVVLMPIETVRSPLGQRPA